MSKPISGVYAPVPTPVGADLHFDADALGRHLRFLKQEGADGALILGTNGEFPSFTVDERREIAAAAAAAGGGLRLMLGVGSCAVGEVVTLLRQAVQSGFDGALLPPPFYFRGAPVSGLADFVRRSLDAAGLPLLLYHIPQVTGVPFDDRLLDAIGDHANLAGVKDSTGDPNELRRLSRRFAEGSYLVGSDRLVAACREAGGAGSISAAASVVPSLVASVADRPELQDDLIEVRDLLDAYGLGPAVKAILRSRGLGEYATRPPLEDLEARRATELLRRFAELTGG